jgi:hypothetical protein
LKLHARVVSVAGKKKVDVVKVLDEPTFTGDDSIWPEPFTDQLKSPEKPSAFKSKGLLVDAVNDPPVRHWPYELIVKANRMRTVAKSVKLLFMTIVLEFKIGLRKVASKGGLGSDCWWHPGLTKDTE